VKKKESSISIKCNQKNLFYLKNLSKLGYVKAGHREAKAAEIAPDFEAEAETISPEFARLALSRTAPWAMAG
jgi:hypothetical protein